MVAKVGILQFRVDKYRDDVERRELVVVLFKFLNRRQGSISRSDGSLLVFRPLKQIRKKLVVEWNNGRELRILGTFHVFWNNKKWIQEVVNFVDVSPFRIKQLVFSFAAILSRPAQIKRVLSYMSFFEPHRTGISSKRLRILQFGFTGSDSGKAEATLLHFSVDKSCVLPSGSSTPASAKAALNNCNLCGVALAPIRRFRI